jgi:adenylate cyclase
MSIKKGEPVERRLAALLAADVAGYSRLIGADEEGTVRALQMHLAAIKPLVRDHGGSVIDTAGDGLLAEFASTVVAVRCAAAIQALMAERNATVAADRRLSFRIGVNQGDVIYDEGRLYGDGVNVAARLEALARPGGIAISGRVMEDVAGKLDLAWSDSGEHSLKNIARPVRVWMWDSVGATKRSSTFTIGLAADMPSIAVLPLVVMGNDPDQGFLADGLVEDITTTLSKLSGLSVITRKSSFAYRDRDQDVRQIALELGARFVLEGGVRKAGDRIRITVQLVDARTGVHVWAERFDREMKDIFALQDEITLTLATEMQVKLTEGEQARLRYTTTTNVEAWSLWIQGLNHSRGPHSTDFHSAACRCWERALELDPNSAPLNAMLAFRHFSNARHGWTGEDRESALGKAQAYVERALAIDPANADAHRAASGILLLKSQFDDATVAARKAVKLGPSIADVLSFGTFVLTCCGHAAEGVVHVERAIALGPNYPAHYLGVLGNAYRIAGRPEEALAAFWGYHAREPGLGLADIVMIQEQADRLEEARETAAQLAVVRPTFTIASFVRTQFRYDVQQLEADIASLRASGVRER